MLWTFVIGVYIFNMLLIPAYMNNVLGFENFMTMFYPIRIDFIFYIAIIIVIFCIVERNEIPGWFYKCNRHDKYQFLTRIVFIISALMMLPFLADNNFIFYNRVQTTQPFTEPFWFVFINTPIYVYQLTTIIDFVLGIIIWKFVDQWWKLPPALMALSAVYINLLVFLGGAHAFPYIIQFITYFIIMVAIIIIGSIATLQLRKKTDLLFKKDEKHERK